MLWIIAGPSSSGKSTFLDSPALTEITGLPSTTTALFARVGVAEQVDRLKDYYFHYNFLRFLEPALKNPGATEIWGITVPAPGVGFDYALDTTWDQMASLAMPKKAIVLVISRSLLMERVAVRTVIEPRNIQPGRTHSYPAAEWLEIYGRVDFVDAYRVYLTYLRSKDIDHVLLDSTTSAYSPLRDFGEAARLLQS